MLLKKNEEALLTLKFDEILSFLNIKLFDCYLVRFPFHLGLQFNISQIKRSSDDSDQNAPKYRVDEFVNEAASLRITPFMLDCYRHEYEDLVVCNSHPFIILGYLSTCISVKRINMPRKSTN
jgi:hypothetical protein